MRMRGSALIVLLLAAFVSQPASAWPDKPIHLIIGAPPGGTSDAMARVVQRGLERRLGQPVIVESRPGAGGMIAINAVAKAPADGYMLGLGGAGALGALLGLQEMTYDPRKDIVPVAAIAGTPFILAAAPSFQGQSLREVLVLARGGVEKMSIAHGGNGTTMHLTAELFNQMAGTAIALVPYRGSAPVVTDLMGSHIALGIVDPPSAIAAIEGGKIKPLAIASPARFPRFPDIPTFAEAGLPGFESNGWVGIVAPAGTPADVIAKLNEAIVAELKTPEVIERIRGLGSEPMPMTSTEFASFVSGEIEKWLKVATASKAK